MTKIDKKYSPTWLYPVYGIFCGIGVSIIFIFTGGFGLFDIATTFIDRFFDNTAGWSILLSPFFFAILGFVIGVFLWKKPIGVILLVILIGFYIHAGVLTYQQLTYTPLQLIKAWGLASTDEIAKEYNLIPWDVSYKLGKHEGIKRYNSGDGKYRFKKKVALYWLKKDGLIKDVKK